MYTISLRRIVFLFIVSFVILYIQPLSIGPIKVSFVLVGAIQAYTFFKVLSKKTSRDLTNNLSFAVAFKVLFSVGFYYNVGQLVIDFLKTLTFPLIYLYSRIFFNLKKLRFIIIIASLMLILCCVPFLLKLVQPLQEGYSLGIFGGETSGFVGYFENSHSASITISFATLNLIYYFLVSSKGQETIKGHKALFIIAILIGVYVIYSTYVRTGYLTLLSGGIWMVLKGINRKNFAIYFGAAFLFITVLLTLYTTDTAFRNRISDKQEYSTGDASKDLGSGRLIFQIAAFEIWSNGNIGEKFLGIGMETFTDEMSEQVGRKIYAHNGFTTTLVKDGLIGLVLFVLFFIYLFKSSFSSKNPDAVLAQSICIAYLCYQLVQGNIISPIMEILLACTFSLISIRRTG